MRQIRGGAVVHGGEDFHLRRPRDEQDRREDEVHDHEPDGAGAAKIRAMRALGDLGEERSEEPREERHRAETGKEEQAIAREGGGERHDREERAERPEAARPVAADLRREERADDGGGDGAEADEDRLLPGRREEAEIGGDDREEALHEQRKRAGRTARKPSGSPAGSMYAPEPWAPKPPRDQRTRHATSTAA